MYLGEFTILTILVCGLLIIVGLFMLSFFLGETIANWWHKRKEEKKEFLKREPKKDRERKEFARKIIEEQQRREQEEEKERVERIERIKRMLAVPSYLASIIIDTWTARRKRQIWSTILKSKAGEKITISARGGMGQFPQEVELHIANMGQLNCSFKSLDEFSEQEIQKIENWIVDNRRYFLGQGQHYPQS